MKFATALLAGLAVGATTAHAGAKPIESLPFVGKWNLNYDKNSCHLAATFGDGDKQVMAVFTRYAPGDDLEIALYGKRLSGEAANVDVATDFSSDGTFVKNIGMRGKADKVPLLLVGNRQLLDKEGFQPAITPQQEAAVRDVTIRVGTDKPFKLETGSMGGPMKAMRACTDSLIQSWGFEPAAFAALARPAIPKTRPQTWLQSGDYPRTALFRGAQGVVHFRLDVEADGTASGCHILSEFKPVEFAEVTCKAILSRAGFVPALSQSHQSVRSFYVDTVHWIMAR